MYLKAIEIYGFKSFANKVKLPLKPGITCIVGPNGCGKSNVVDSLKWCIGEMSWKSLRMPSMMDVIFAGTTKRSQQNMAEVAMTFDNESRKLPLDFSEVTVTRKIYRSEESEYFINKVQCRLKDIREMFLDTGIGADGYAIIDQGEVEYVLSASAEERRELFEEAAGVSKYKAKREEALRKLEKVDADLARLADATTLIDEQIKKLDAEAKRARTQQKYKEELTSAEVSMLVKEISGFNGEVDAENAALEPVQKEIAETSTAITALEGELAAMNLTLTQKQEEERVLNEAIASVKFEKVRLEGTIVGNDNTAQVVASQTKALEESGRRNEEALAASAPRIEEARAALAGASTGLDALKNDYETGLSGLAGIEAEMNAVDASAGAIEKNITAAYQTEVEVSNEIASTASSIGHYKDNILGLKKELDGLSAKSAEIESKVRAIRARAGENEASLNAEKDRLAGAEDVKNASAGRLDEIGRRLSDLNAEKAGARSRLEAILAQGEKDSYWVGINNVLNSGVSGIRGTLRHLLTVKKEDKLAVEEALGRFMDAVVCDNSESAREAINYLQHLGKGRCRFLILDKVASAGSPPAWEVPNAVKIRGKISASAEYDAMIDHLLGGIYSSDGSVLGSFWVSGGAEEVTSNEPYWEEEGALKEKIRACEQEETVLSAEKAEVAAKLAEASSLAAALEEKITALNMDLHRAQVEAENAEGEARLNAQNTEFTSAETARAETVLAEAESRLAALNARIEEARLVSEGKRAEMAALSDKKDSLHLAYSKAKEDIGARKANLDNHQKNLELLKEEVFRLESHVERLRSERDSAAARVKELAEQAVQLASETAQARKRLMEVMSELAEKEILEKQLSGETNALRNDYGRLNINLNDSKELREEGEKKRYGIELRINTLKTRSEDLTKRLNEEWNLCLEDAREKFGAVEVDAERVKFLRKRLESMGAVNMTAPEEYDALINRFNFMNSQVEDLNTAKADLRSAIGKINETTRDNFKLTFDKVQGHFKQIYGLLFNGGEANLILTQPENILETGVEILAHPPGKKLVSISQLSGGEKALTALALLFSFFCVNPSPFCVMDEADAPLDEANVERFVRLLREFSGTTQFIVITHNKRTMEAADVLYGVTMEELGVSKIISVDLKKASAMTEGGGKVTAQVGA
ncbi:MAG: chromosome segregation protein SMC [Elusimicrobiales bacterium]|jgi:chromosome segregation protein